MKKGILVLAIGHYNYGRMAAALAASIKATGSEWPIHLVHTEESLSRLSPDELALFDSMALVPEKYIEPVPIRSKMFLYQLSPFDQTLYLDADLVWFNQKPEDLVAELGECKLTFSNFGFSDGPNLWADFDEVREAYALGEEKIYKLHSELVYFIKDAEVKAFFTAARKAYDSIKIKFTTFAGGIPDELPFAIAMAQTKMYPHADNFRPMWWRNSEPVKQLHLLYSDYWGLSMAGNSTTQTCINMYNTVGAAAYYKLKIRYPYQWKTKRSFLIERRAL